MSPCNENCSDNKSNEEDGGNDDEDDDWRGEVVCSSCLLTGAIRDILTKQVSDFCRFRVHKPGDEHNGKANSQSRAIINT